VRRMSLLWPTETDVSENLMTLPSLSNVRTPKMLIGLEGAHVFCWSIFDGAAHLRKFQGCARGDDLGEKWSRAGCLQEMARVCLGDWLDRAEASTNISGTVQPRAGASQQEESP